MRWRELERPALVATACLATLPCLAWLAGGETRISAAMSADWQATQVFLQRMYSGSTLAVDRVMRMGASLAALTGLLAAVLAISLSSRGPARPAARDLARASAIGAALISWYLFVEPMVHASGPSRALHIALHVVANLACVLVLADAYRFLRNYPVLVDIDAATQGEEGGGEPRLRSAWRYLTRLKRINVTVLRLFDNRRTLLFLLVTTVAFDLIVVARTGQRGIGPVLLLFATVVLIEGIGVMTWNARHVVGGEDRRHEWLFLGIWAALLLYLLLPVALLLAASLADAFLPAAASPSTRGATYLVMAIALSGIFDWTFLALVIVLVLVSIFYHGTLDPRLTIRRSSVLALLAAAVGVLFVLLERYAAHSVAQWLGMPQETGWMAAAVIAGVAVLPVRNATDRGVRSLIDRLSAPTELADGERVPAVVVFSDLSGFTALSARDERAAIIAASLLHKAAREVAAAHEGRLVKTIGDAVVLEFERAGDALRAVPELHRRYAQGAALLALPELPVHSGIHAGPVLKARDGDIYGSTVNLAARLQDAAGPGEIVVSEDVRAATQPTVFAWEELGARKFKNVPDPVTCFRLAPPEQSGSG